MFSCEIASESIFVDSMKQNETFFFSWIRNTLSYIRCSTFDSDIVIFSQCCTHTYFLFYDIWMALLKDRCTVQETSHNDRDVGKKNSMVLFKVWWCRKNNVKNEEPQHSDDEYCDNCEYVEWKYHYKGDRRQASGNSVNILHLPLPLYYVSLLLTT